MHQILGNIFDSVFEIESICVPVRACMFTLFEFDKVAAVAEFELGSVFRDRGEFVPGLSVQSLFLSPLDD